MNLLETCDEESCRALELLRRWIIINLLFVGFYTRQRISLPYFLPLFHSGLVRNFQFIRIQSNNRIKILYRVSPQHGKPRLENVHQARSQDLSLGLTFARVTPSTNLHSAIPRGLKCSTFRGKKICKRDLEASRSSFRLKIRQELTVSN